MTYPINDVERKRIRGLYQVNPLKESISQCKASKDGKYILFENRVYSSETGEIIPLNEGWFDMSTSDWAHAFGDVASIGLDFVIPGSGAIVDTLNGISYIIEAQFKDTPEEKYPLYVMSAVQFAFVLIPGALQGAIFPLKKFLKTGVVSSTAKPIVEKALKLVLKYSHRISVGLPRILWKALNSRFGKALVKKFGREKIERLAGKGYVQELRKAFDFVLGTKTVGKAATKAGGKVTMKSMGMFFKNLPKIARGNYIIKKLGFKIGKDYGLIYNGAVQRVKILGGTGTNIIIRPIGVKGVGKVTMPIESFLKSTVSSPYLLKGKSKSVPLFIRTFARWVLPDGSGLDNELVDATVDLDPSQTSMESLAYLQDELAKYEGDTGNYTINTTVQTIQKALISLGYPLPRAGADGKFGPETQKALQRFQGDNNLGDFQGKINRQTADKLALELRERGIRNSEGLQQSLRDL